MTDAADWDARATEVSSALVRHYWDPRRGLFRTTTARRVLPWGGPWHYWWQAHALDALVDAYVRTGDAALADTARRHVDGIVRRNEGRIVNDYYDDMAWMGLALQRAGTAGILDADPLVATLLAEILDGRDPACGAVVWRRGDTFLNVPANAPSAILAARTGDVSLARHLVGWVHSSLVDADTYEVWDGVRETGPVRAAYTYNYGTVVGADVALHARTGDPALLRRGRRVASAARARLAPDGVLVDEGGGDGGLFKGILARYLAELAVAADDAEVRRFVLTNAAAAWHNRSAEGLVGPDWRTAPAGPVELSVHLSGVLLVEAAARVAR